MANLSTSSVDYGNWTEDEIRAYQDFVRQDRRNEVILTGMTQCVAPFGLLMNLIFLYVVARVRSMHSILNIYLTNLAVVDIVFLTAALTVALTFIDTFELEILTSVAFSTLVASFCFVTAVAFERFFAVRSPLTFRATASKGRAAKISAALWVLTVVSGIGQGFASRIKPKLIISVIDVILYVTTLSINIVLYACVVKKLRNQPILGTGQRRRVSRVVAMLILNTFVFFSFSVLLVVENIFAIVIVESDLSTLNFLKNAHSLQYVRLVTGILDCINRSINPLIYSGMNKDYWAAFAKAFFCPNLRRLCRRKRNTSPPAKPMEQIELQVVRQKPAQE